MESDEVLVGILSDTHGRGELAARAAAILSAYKVRRVFHCGDIGNESVVDALAGLEVCYVFGNMDRNRAALRRYIRAVGATLGEPVARCELAGRQIAALHGDDAAALRELLDSQELDYLFHGHTHVAHSEHVGRTHVINPGALHRARVPTVAVLEVSADRLQILAV